MYTVCLRKRGSVTLSQVFKGHEVISKRFENKTPAIHKLLVMPKKMRSNRQALISYSKLPLECKHIAFRLIKEYILQYSSIWNVQYEEIMS